MENWGIIVHQWNMLIYQNNSMREGDVQRRTRTMIDLIITHELVHQWFGNLVTMNFWDDLWLNEGFAQFFAGFFVRPDSPDIIGFFDAKIKADLLDLQSSDFNRIPLVHNYATIEETEALFSNYGFYHLYLKGSYMVKMLSDLLRPENLRAGLVDYCRNSKISA